MTRAATILLAGLFVMPASAMNSSQSPIGRLPTDQKAVLADYEQMLAVVFRDLFASDVVARMIVEPAFEGEYAVALTQTDAAAGHDPGGYSIVGQFAQVSLWAYQALRASSDGRKIILNKDGTTRVDPDEFARLEAELPSDFREVKVTRCEAAIPQGLGKSITSIWRQILNQQTSEAPRKDEEAYEMTFSGAKDTDSFFWTKGEPELVGRKLNPTTPSKMGFLAVIGDALLNYCEHKDEYSLSMLNQLSAGLEKDLRTEH